MSEELIIGIEEIDRQHQELFERLDLLRDFMRRGQSRDAIHDTLKFLEEYATEHFATEVRYMNQYRYDYSDILRHKAEHETFFRNLTAFKEKFADLKEHGEITTFLGLDVLRTLNDWFSNHIMTIDRKMGEYLAERMKDR